MALIRIGLQWQLMDIAGMQPVAISNTDDQRVRGVIGSSGYLSVREGGSVQEDCDQMQED